MENQSVTSSKKEKKEKQRVSMFCCFSSTKKRKNKTKIPYEQSSLNTNDKMKHDEGIVHLSNTSLNSGKEKEQKLSNHLDNLSKNTNEIGTSEKEKDFDNNNKQIVITKTNSLKPVENNVSKVFNTENNVNNNNKESQQCKVSNFNKALPNNSILNDIKEEEKKEPSEHSKIKDVKQNLNSKFTNIDNPDLPSQNLPNTNRITNPNKDFITDAPDIRPKTTTKSAIHSVPMRPPLKPLAQSHSQTNSDILNHNHPYTNREVTPIKSTILPDIPIASPSARQISVNPNADFTFKKTNEIEKQNSNLTNINTKPISSTINMEDLENRHVLSPVMDSIEKKSIKLNYINNNVTNSSKMLYNTSNGIITNSSQTIHNNDNENNSEYVPDEVDDEFGNNSERNESKINDDTHSVVSSYVLSVPKMISGINESYAPSVYTRSEFKDNASNFLPTEGSNAVRIIPSGINDTEFEITNENGEGFRALIETPRSNANYIKKARDYSYTNHQLRDIDEKIHRKEKEIKTLNEKINQIMSKIQRCEEENKKYDRWIEKEESEGEMLRHMLNFLNSNMNK